MIITEVFNNFECYRKNSLTNRHERIDSRLAKQLTETAATIVAENIPPLIYLPSAEAQQYYRPPGRTYYW